MIDERAIMSSCQSLVRPSLYLPHTSSPLAGSPQGHSPSFRPSPARKPAHLKSRSIRPLPFSLQTVPTVSKDGRRPIKFIEPPKNQRCTFVLNLTQAEFSRQGTVYWRVSEHRVILSMWATILPAWYEIRLIPTMKWTKRVVHWVFCIISSVFIKSAFITRQARVSEVAPFRWFDL